MRNKNLDLLRVIACAMVVMIHVGTLFGMGINEEDPSYYFMIGNFFHAFPRTAVPLFVMISGGLLLSNPKNKNIKVHYTKTFKRLIIPTMIFSFGYTLLSICFDYIENGNAVDLGFAIKSWILGWPYYHMWYMYMIIGCYAITPFLIWLCEKVGDQIFASIGVIFLGIALWNYQVEVLWPFKFIFYLGYFIMGYSLKRVGEAKEIPWKISLISSIAILIGVVIVTYYRILNGQNNPFYFLSSLSITIMISAILMYIGFISMPMISLNFYPLASHTFYIYLFHAGVLDVIDFIVRKRLTLSPNPIWYLPFMLIIVFIISLELSKGLEKLNIYIRKKSSKTITAFLTKKRRN